MTRRGFRVGPRGRLAFAVSLSFVVAAACTDAGAPDGPALAVVQAGQAFEAKDLEGFESNVAIDRALASTMDSVLALITERGYEDAATAQDSMNVQMAVGFGQVMKTMVVQLGGQTVRESVREGKLKVPDATRSQLEQMAPDSTRINPDRLDEVDLESTAPHTVMSGGDAARVRFDLTGTNLETDERETWPIELLLQKSPEGAWQVVGLGNVRELADLIEERNSGRMN
ncbi:MAG: hypothetical protein ACR2GQ_03800 [Gemmatimonadota bacterium]